MSDVSQSVRLADASAHPLADSGRGVRASLISAEVLKELARALEFITIAASGLILFAVYLGHETAAPFSTYLLVSMLAAAATIMSFQLLHLYETQAFASILRQVPRLWLGWSIAFALLVTAAFLLKIGAEFSRAWLSLWYATGGVALIGGRIALALAVKTWMRDGRLFRRAVIVGAGEAAADLIRALEKDRDSDIRIRGVFDDRGRDRVASVVAGYPLLGNLDELVAFGRLERVDMLILSLPQSAETRVLQVMRKLMVLPVDIRLAALSSKLRFRPRAYSYIGSVPFIDIADRPIADWNLVQKWLFDKVIGTLALLALAPVMAAVAIAIRLDSRGPVLFRQKRYGFNNELVEVLKFRSMHVERADAAAARLVTKDDPRVTRVGRFIRKTSLDELPQLFNVVFGGRLSLVGPRPHALQAKADNRLYQDVVDGYFARHKVKPGLSGWAQINGWRGETDTAEKIQKRVEHDFWYIENWSVFLDLYILARTPFALLKAENAY